jgi:multicomponent Na+:H+ antiporter subunit D
MLDASIPVLAVLSSLVPGLWIFALDEARVAARTALNLTGAVLKVALVLVMMWGTWYGHRFEFRMPVLEGFDFVLRADAPGLLFVSLSAVLWLFTTVYAIGYLEDSPNRSRFFGFFSLCVSATIGIALAGNLFTFVIFYEMLTLSTYPLVVHRGTPAALRAGRVYLRYTLSGGAALLLGAVWLGALVGPIEFDEGASLARLGQQSSGTLVAIFALLVAGLGVKAALVPLHGWLPVAMVAPAPVSALLHAVAVVKAGAFGIVRVVYDVYGIRFSDALGVMTPLAALAGVTIVYGSVRALFQDDLKRRLAFSTISQVAYIVLGVAVVGPSSTLGGVVHLVHQGLMKITLFFCAGNLAETLGLHKVSELDGVGRRMPWTMAAFAVAALGMIGVPPVAGFVSKYYLGAGALEAGQPWVLLALGASTALNAAYFLPILVAAWFRPPRQPWPDRPAHASAETRWALLVPTIATALLSLQVGLLAGTYFSPLRWVELIVARAYLLEQVSVLPAVAAPVWRWLAAVAVPAVTAACMMLPRARRAAIAAAPWTAVPALALAMVAPPGGPFEMPWLLPGALLVLDGTGRVFLAVTALLWIAAGVYARGWLARDAGRHRFMGFVLLALSGNLLAVLAADGATFYTGFAVMTFAAYPLVVHGGGAGRMRAGRVYLPFVVAGEVLLVSGIAGLAGLAGSAAFDALHRAAAAPGGLALLACVLAGFAIKIGVVPVHAWLPPTYAAAPIPAAAILAGPMITAGLLGWLRLLPLGAAPVPLLGAVCVAGGIASAFWGVAAGLAQRDARAALGYSSVSQMGLMTIAVGLGLMAPLAWPVLLPAVWLYAVHHAVAKTALFLGAGVAARAGARRAIVLAGLALPALALAGAPLTSGAAAKLGLKKGVEAANLAPGPLELLLSLAAVGTTLLLARVIVLALRDGRGETDEPEAALLWPWLALVAGSALAVWIVPGPRTLAAATLEPAALWASLWPAAAGLLIAGWAWRRPGLEDLAERLALPPGDLLRPLAAASAVVGSRVRDRWIAAAGIVRAARPRLSDPLRRAGRAGVRGIEHLEAVLQRPDVWGGLLLLIAGGLALLMTG